jgi:hypothetical protein
MSRRAFRRMKKMRMQRIRPICDRSPHRRNALFYMFISVRSQGINRERKGLFRQRTTPEESRVPEIFRFGSEPFVVE